MFEDLIEYRVQVNEQDGIWKTQTVREFGGHTLPDITPSLGEALIFLGECREKTKYWDLASTYRIVKTVTTFEVVDE